jgi:diguanylate cyclase (GGDEF)-like protein/PAS domain S-box-containing protein
MQKTDGPTESAHATPRDGTPAPARGECDRCDLLTLALTGSGTGLWDRDVAIGEIQYSPAWKAMLGYGPHELSTRIEDAYLRIHPDDLAYVQATMQAHFENKTDSYSVEHRIRCKDGSYKWIRSRGKVVSRDSEGRAQRMVGTTTDITALRETAQSLQRTIDLITNLTNEVPGLVFQYRLGADGRATVPYASEGIREIYELAPEDVLLSAGPIEARIDARDIAAYRQSLHDSAERLTPWRLQYRVNLPGQGVCWRQGDARPQRMPDGSTLWHGFITDATDRKRIEAELHELATIDHLTQLSNRRHFTMQSEIELTRIRAGQTGTAAILMLDLDHFKILNDRWGHALGDRALSHFAELLRTATRAGDIVGRIGGEEFAAVLPQTTTDDAVAFARRVQHRLVQFPLLGSTRDEPVPLTVSIGVDTLRATDAGAYQALSRCDKALYVAKARGRNRIEVYEEAADGLP